MKRIRKRFFIITLFFLLLLVAGYFSLGLYYMNGFSVNTWINGVYCTGKTVEEVNEQLLLQEELPETITIVGLETSGEKQTEKSWYLPAKEIAYSMDYTAQLESYIAGQRQWLWPDNFTAHRRQSLQPKIFCDEEKLLNWFDGTFGNSQTTDGRQDYRITYNGEKLGYCLFDGTKNLLDEKRAYETVKEGIAAGETTISLVESGCYYDAALSAEQEETRQLWEQLEAFQNNGPVYDFSEEQERPDAAVMALFLKKDSEEPYLPILDKHGQLQLDVEQIAEYVEYLSDKYSTYGKEWEFQSTRGDVVTVPGGTYGGQLDTDAETLWLTEYLKGLIQAGSNVLFAEEAHVPAYTREPFSRSSRTPGDTYVEVDMGIQKLYYYSDGELQLETDIVSGNRGRTPAGVNFVYAKEKNRVLRGPGYASHVDYWMPVKGGIGLHDASWRDEFGGEIYKTNGSHGCINIPSEVMAELYEMVEIGTPVVMFY